MVSVNQTSWFEIQENEALGRLRVFPLTVPMSDTPTLLYRLDGEPKIGSLVSFRLVVGFRIVNWKGFISSVNGSNWTADLKQGPFSLFHAEHSASQNGSALECRDEFVFNGEAPDFSDAIEKANILYAFAARKATLDTMNAFESRRQTERLAALNSGFSAG